MVLMSEKGIKYAEELYAEKFNLLLNSKNEVFNDSVDTLSLFKYEAVNLIVMVTVSYDKVLKNVDDKTKEIFLRSCANEIQRLLDTSLERCIKLKYTPYLTQYPIFFNTESVVKFKNSLDIKIYNCLKSMKLLLSSNTEYTQLFADYHNVSVKSVLADLNTFMDRETTKKIYLNYK